MVPTGSTGAQCARAVGAVIAAGVVAVGSPGVGIANADNSPGTGSRTGQTNQVPYADAVGGIAVPENWLDPVLAGNGPDASSNGYVNNVVGAAVRPSRVVRGDDDDDIVVTGGRGPGGPSSSGPGGPSSSGPGSSPSSGGMPFSPASTESAASMPGGPGGAPSLGAAIPEVAGQTPASLAGQSVMSTTAASPIVPVAAQ
jgi:hypothetical protein